MLRSAPKLTAILLGASLLAGCASAMPDFTKLTGGSSDDSHARKEQAAAKIDKSTPTDLEGGIRQAQLMRNAGQYDDAIHVLSQLMLVASDDPRVVSEYGKSLAEKGRAQDAVEFLNRAIELSANDWTLYSALGVSYDQLGNQTAARAAYEHALALKPDEPSVLNNYALSRMLANDPDGARRLIAEAKAAGGDKDAKIAANIAMLNKLAPTQDVASAEKPAPAPAPAKPPVAATANAAPAKPISQPQSAQSPAQSTSAPSTPAQGAPRVMVSPVASLPPMVQQRALTPLPSGPQPAQQASAQQPMAQPSVRQSGQPQQVAAAPAASVRSSGVVMQPVPFDPYAGPVTTSVKTSVKPSSNPAPAKVAAEPKSAPKAVALVAPPVPAMPVPPKIVIAEPSKPESKPAPAAKLAANNSAKPAPVSTASARIDIKPDAKPVADKSGSANEVPALRLTADARNP